MSGAIPCTIEQGWLERADGDENLAEGTLWTENEVVEELDAEEAPGIGQPLRHGQIIFILIFFF